MAEILSLVPSCGTVAPASTIADDLAVLAGSIQSGEFGDVSSAILLILNCCGEISSVPVGRVLSSLEAVGLCEFAKAVLMFGEDA